MLILACLMVTFSDIPLVVSLLLITLIVNQFLDHGFMVKTMRGAITIKSSQMLEHKRVAFRLRKVIFSLDRVALLLFVDQNQRFILWRDSFDEASYRRLILLLKKEL